MLTSPEERMRLLEQYGADVVCVSPFIEELRDMPPEAFIKLLKERWHPKAVVIGYNYNFGRHGKGNAETMRSFGDQFGYETVVIPEVRQEGKTVSSTRIRRLLAEGDIAGAEALLGHSLQDEKRK